MSAPIRQSFAAAMQDPESLAASLSTRRPAISEVIYYQGISAFNRNVYDVSSYDRIRLPEQFSGSIPPIFLGRQPDNTLMSRLESEHPDVNRSQIHSVSVLKSFEHENTAGIPKENQHRIGAADNEPMSVDRINAGVAWMKRLVEQRHPIYIHCKSGVGRSATVLAAFLVDHCGMTLAQAIGCIRESRPKVTLGRPGHYHVTALQSWCATRPREALAPVVLDDVTGKKAIRTTILSVAEELMGELGFSGERISPRIFDQQIARLIDCHDAHPSDQRYPIYLEILKSPACLERIGPALRAKLQSIETSILEKGDSQSPRGAQIFEAIQAAQQKLLSSMPQWSDEVDLESTDFLENFCSWDQHGFALPPEEFFMLYKNGKDWMDETAPKEGERPVFNEKKLRKLSSVSLTSTAYALTAKSASMAWRVTAAFGSALLRPFRGGGASALSSIKEGERVDSVRSQRQRVLETLVSVIWAFVGDSRGEANRFKIVNLQDVQKFKTLLNEYEGLVRQSDAAASFMQPIGNRTTYPICFNSTNTPLKVLPNGNDAFVVTELGDGSLTLELGRTTFKTLSTDPIIWPAHFVDAAESLWIHCSKETPLPATVNETLEKVSAVESSDEQIVRYCQGMKILTRSLISSTVELPEKEVRVNLRPLTAAMKV